MAYNWVPKSPVHVPPGRFSYMLCWDGEHILMYGGRANSPSAVLGDTWTWNGTDWTERFPAHSPSVLEAAAIAYDIANDQVVLFGGNSDEAGQDDTNNETWIWDRNDWTQVFPAHSPSSRLFTNAAYDETRSEVVLFSGADNSGVPIQDTWIWDGTDWTEKFPVNSPYDHGVNNQIFSRLAWDPTNHLVVFMPSSLVPGFNGTWTWNGTNWTEHSSTNHPTGVEFPGLANWRIGGKPLAFAGRTGGLPDLPTSGTFSWNGSDWTNQAPVNNPFGRADILLAYDETHLEVVLFGGLIAGFPALSDTWVYELVGGVYHLESVAR